MTIKQFPAREQEGVVPMLTDLLGKATRGEITDFALAAIHDDGDVGFYAPSTERHYKLLGAVAALVVEMHLAKIGGAQ